MWVKHTYKTEDGRLKEKWSSQEFNDGYMEKWTPPTSVETIYRGDNVIVSLHTRSKTLAIYIRQR